MQKQLDELLIVLSVQLRLPECRPRITLTSHLITQPVDESCVEGKANKGPAHLPHTVALKLAERPETDERSIRQESRRSIHRAFFLLLTPYPALLIQIIQHHLFKTIKQNNDRKENK